MVFDNFFSPATGIPLQDANRFLWKWSRIHTVFHCHHGRVSFGGVKNKTLAVLRDTGRALGPKGLDFTKPSANFASKETVGGILLATELIRQTAGAEKRNVHGWTVQCPRLPDQPNVQIEYPGGVPEKRHDLSLDGNAVLVDLVVEGLTEHDEVLSA